MMYTLSLIAITLCCMSLSGVIASDLAMPIDPALPMSPVTEPLPAISPMTSKFFGQSPSFSSVSKTSSSSKTPQFIPLPSLSMSATTFSNSPVDSNQLPALLNQSSFPLLGSSAAAHLSVTPQVESIPQSLLLSMDLLAIETIYAKFTRSMAPLLSKTSNRITKKIKNLENMTQLQRLQHIPSLLKLYTPIYASFANGTNLIADAKLVQKNPTGPGPYIYLTTPQWKTILNGLTLFGGSSLDIVHLIHQLENTTMNVLSSMRNVTNDTITVDLSKVNDEYGLGIALALSNKNIQRSFKIIESIHKQGITKYQTNKNSIDFLESYFSWLLDVAAVFRLISPNIKELARVFLRSGGTANSTAGTFCLNYLGVDALVEQTNTELAKLIRILGDYFELFNVSVEGMLSKLSSKI